MKINLSDLIAPQFYNIHWDILEGRHTHYKLYGGRGSTKSSFISIEIIMGTESVTAQDHISADRAEDSVSGMR